MSTQGTGSIDQLAFERMLLDAWGLWSRSGDLGLGFNPVDWLRRGSVGLMFSDDDMAQADQAICRLAPRYKRVIKAVYLYRKSGGIPGAEITESIAYFTEALHRDGEGAGEEWKAIN